VKKKHELDRHSGPEVVESLIKQIAALPDIKLPRLNNLAARIDVLIDMMEVSADEII
jgi:hypothetical protein